MPQVDWLSRLLQMLAISGRLEVRCAYGAPWRVAWDRAAAREIPYHVVLRGRAVIEDSETRTVRELEGGDIVLLPHGSSHVLHDGSGNPPVPTQERSVAGLMVSENDASGERLDMLCGRFLVGPPHDRLIRSYLPMNLIVRAGSDDDPAGAASASTQLADLVGLMRMESASDKAGAQAVLNALSSALFALVLRAAGASNQVSEGLLALAGHARLAPAISAMFADPARAWNQPDLADLCGMSRATFVRHFQDKLGRRPVDRRPDEPCCKRTEEAWRRHRGCGRSCRLSVRGGLPARVHHDHRHDARPMAPASPRNRPRLTVRTTDLAIGRFLSIRSICLSRSRLESMGNAGLEKARQIHE